MPEWKMGPLKKSPGLHMGGGILYSGQPVRGNLPAWAISLSAIVTLNPLCGSSARCFSANTWPPLSRSSLPLRQWGIWRQPRPLRRCGVTRKISMLSIAVSIPARVQIGRTRMSSRALLRNIGNEFIARGLVHDITTSRANRAPARKLRRCQLPHPASSRAI